MARFAFVFALFLVTQSMHAQVVQRYQFSRYAMYANGSWGADSVRTRYKHDGAGRTVEQASYQYGSTSDSTYKSQTVYGPYGVVRFASFGKANGTWVWSTRIATTYNAAGQKSIRKDSANRGTTIDVTYWDYTYDTQGRYTGYTASRGTLPNVAVGRALAAHLCRSAYRL